MVSFLLPHLCQWYLSALDVNYSFTLALNPLKGTTGSYQDFNRLMFYSSAESQLG